MDDGINREDIFTDDDYLFDDDDEQETKQLCDYVLDDVDQNDILFKQELIDGTPNYPSSPEPLTTFSDILLKKNKNMEKLAKKIKKNTKN